jgi:hypothetical protein
MISGGIKDYVYIRKQSVLATVFYQLTLIPQHQHSSCVIYIITSVFVADLVEKIRNTLKNVKNKTNRYRRS